LTTVEYGVPRNPPETLASWLVLAACSVVEARAVPGRPGEEGDGLAGTGVEWLLSSGELHGVLGYDAGATWFGGLRRENVFVGEAFARRLAAGVPVARAWMEANRDAANRFHAGDRGRKFSSTNATALVWEAFEGEGLGTLDRARTVPEGDPAVYMLLRRDETRARGPWRISFLRGRPVAEAAATAAPACLPSLPSRRRQASTWCGIVCQERARRVGRACRPDATPTGMSAPPVVTLPVRHVCCPCEASA
jgi:hypothetical protein